MSAKREEKVVQTIGHIRAVLGDAPDDAQALFMIAAPEGPAWTMRGDVIWNPDFGRLTIRLHHPDITALPSTVDVKSKTDLCRRLERALAILEGKDDGE